MSYKKPDDILCKVSETHFKIYVSGSTKTVQRYIANPHIGQLLTPHDRNRVISGLSLAVDNSAFSNWCEKSFLKLLKRLSGYKPVWVSAPDVVGDAIATERLLHYWSPIIKDFGFPVAYVLQNGLESIGLPPDKYFDAVFIGGDNSFKLGQYVRYVVRKIRQKKQLVHMGRVNSITRLQYAYEIGCTSVDGTGFSRFSNSKLPPALRHIARPQLPLFGGVV